jgi:hypothetical protein
LGIGRDRAELGTDTAAESPEPGPQRSKTISGLQVKAKACGVLLLLANMLLFRASLDMIERRLR